MGEAAVMQRVGAAWKPNWQETKRRFADWWRGKGFLIGGGPVPARAPHAEVEDPGPPASVEARWTDAAWRLARSHFAMSRSGFPMEVLPLVDLGLGPGVLGLYLGCEPGFAENTVWYEPRPEPLEEMPALRFDAAGRWWRLTEEMLRGAVANSAGNYYVGVPDLIENWDTLAQLRGTEPLLVDMIEHPDAVLRKIGEINTAFFEAYQRIYDIVADQDGGICFGAFRLWAPGTVAKVQCDGSAMFSPEMFRQFVVPALREQCAWLDYSMFHLDGTQCVVHLDHLLAIDELDALEWTPQTSLPGGADPCWYEIYRRTRRAGKSVQIVHVRPDEIPRVLDELGPDGLYFMTHFREEGEVERTMRAVEQYR